MPRIAFVAALDREVAPLTATWKALVAEHEGKRYRFFENGNAVLVCGGIGAECARRATEAVIQHFHPDRAVSVGFAGALDGTLKVADVLEPAVVICANDGSRTETGMGRGSLVSFAEVVSREQKDRLTKSYQASAVDMEAAAVARGARARGLAFGALKAISDASNFDMAPTGKFIASDGRFQTMRFAVHVALRPWLWRWATVLARNSSSASKALCAAIAQYADRETLKPGIESKEAGGAYVRHRS